MQWTAVSSIKSNVPYTAFVLWTALSALLRIPLLQRIVPGAAAAEQSDCCDSACSLAGQSGGVPVVSALLAFTYRALVHQLVLFALDARHHWQDGTLQQWFKDHYYGASVRDAPPALP